MTPPSGFFLDISTGRDYHILVSFDPNEGLVVDFLLGRGKFQPFKVEGVSICVGEFPIRIRLMVTDDPDDKPYAYMMFEGPSRYTVEYDLRPDKETPVVIARLTNRNVANGCQQLAPTLATFRSFRWSIAGSGLTVVKDCQKPDGTLTLAVPPGKVYRIC